MHVSIEHSHTSTGLIRKTNHHFVTATVEFAAEERAIIEKNKLQRDIVLKREIPSHLATTKNVKGFLNNKLAEYTGGHENGRYNLFIGTLLDGPDAYSLSTPIEAKEYESELMDALKNLKGYIEGNTAIGADEKKLTFEL